MVEIPALPIRRVSRLDLAAADWPWPFAEQRRDEIEAYFARLREDRPALWNGRVLLAREPRFTESTFSASYFETDFASFLFWRDLGFPDKQVFNGFGMGALCGSDGGFLLGEMGPQTANAGKVYFASGMIDQTDRHGDRIDMPANVAREVWEETGLKPEDYRADPFWDIIAQEGRIAMIRRLQAHQPAIELRERIAGFIASEANPELSAIHLVSGISDISPAMPGFIATYLASQFG